MENTIITYETFHGSAKKVAEIIGKKINSKVINVNTPFEAEDLSKINNIILVFNFRGPYTAQLTKLYLSRVNKQLLTKNIILVGEGLFSEQEFPVVAKEISNANPSKSFNKFFVKGQLRMDTLFPEERVLLSKFSEITKMEIKDMGELDIRKAEDIAEEINTMLLSDDFKSEEANETPKSGKKWICPICGYVHYGDNPPEICPLCGAPGNLFKEG